MTSSAVGIQTSVRQWFAIPLVEDLLAGWFSVLHATHQLDSFGQQSFDCCLIGKRIVIANSIFDHAKRNLRLLQTRQHALFRRCDGSLRDARSNRIKRGC